MDLEGPWQAAARGAHLWVDGVAQPTVFARMSARAAALGAMNLGQGFPDTAPPPVVAETAQRNIREGVNQYPPGAGRPELRAAIARHQERFYALAWDPGSEVLVTTGATEAIAAAILALVRPGDEVVTLEPFYDSYAATIALAGGVHRTVPFEVRCTDGELSLSVAPHALREAVTDATRLILLNSPHNPTGAVLGREVLEALVEAACAHDAIIVSDEVYEHLTFAASHVPVATLPGARERTITIGSAGKTLSVTGWKIGWVTAVPELVAAVTGVKQWLTFTSGAPFQGAVARGLELPEAQYAAIADDLARRRDLLVDTLRGIGAHVAVPEAGYFVLADLSPLGEDDATALCERLPEEAGVVAIPVAAFCHDDAAGGHASQYRSLVRFAFCKDDATLAEAARRLGAWARGRRGA